MPSQQMTSRLMGGSSGLRTGNWPMYPILSTAESSERTMECIGSYQLTAKSFSLGVNKRTGGSKQFRPGSGRVLYARAHRG